MLIAGVERSQNERKEAIIMDKNPKHPLKKKNKADAKKHQKHVYE